MSKSSNLLKEFYNPSNYNLLTFNQRYLPNDIRSKKRQELKEFQKFVLDANDWYRMYLNKDIDSMDKKFYQNLLGLFKKAQDSKGFANLPIDIIVSFFQVKEEIESDMRYPNDQHTDRKKTLVLIDEFLDLLDDYANDIL